jgi:hypothetical protein
MLNYVAILKYAIWFAKDKLKIHEKIHEKNTYL